MFENRKIPAKQQMLPMTAWAAVLGIAIGLVLLLAYVPVSFDLPYRNMHEVRDITFKTKLENLQKEYPRKPGEYRVVVFGSSLTEHGVLTDQYFNQRFTELGKNVRVNRVFYIGAYYKMLENEDFQKFLRTLQPDLLCLEDQAFLYTPLEDLIWQEPLFTRIHKNYVFHINALKHQLLPAYFPPVGMDAIIDPSGTFDIPHPRADSVIARKDSINFVIEHRDIRRMNATKEFNQTLKALKKSGTDIVILHLPRPGRVEKDFFPGDTKKERDQLIQQYNEEVGLEFWEFEQPLPFKYYWDISHLNKYGQSVYSEWLFEKIDRHTTGSKK